MNNFGYNPDNTLLNLLKNYIPQQSTEAAQTETQTKRSNDNSTITTFEVNAKSDLEYLKPEESGRLQMVYCRPEKRVYVGRYNFARQEMDWEAFLSEGEVKLFQKNDSNEEMSKIAEALVAVANKLDTMRGEIQSIKKFEPKVIEAKPSTIEKPIDNKLSDALKELEYKRAEVEMLSASKKNRSTNGQFKKRSES